MSRWEESTLEKVTLLPGIFQTSQEKGKEYLLSLQLDRLLAPFYEAASLQPKAQRYDGWEAMEISGHSLGHWLSAAAMMYRATEDTLLLQKIHYVLDELEYIQSLDEKGYVSGFPRDCFDKTFTGEFDVGYFHLAGWWVPWYSLHKVFAGLIDVYQLLKIEQALKIVTKLANWAKQGTDQLNDEQFQRMLICEHGGMNEAMADLYMITKNEDYLELAIRFCHKEVLDLLAKGIDKLEGKHANTQIPKVIGAAKLYEITGDNYYKNIALFFWNQVVKKRSYIIGGNSNHEHFGPLYDETLSVETNETCNTYNMLKLTEILYRWEQKAEYMDYYERALYNHILASQDPDSGMAMYFVSTKPGHFKVYSTPEHSFWCCTGTGMENPARHQRNIYYQNQDHLYINLFIPSQVEGADFVLKQETNFPYDETVTLTILQAPSTNYTINIRIPEWVDEPLSIAINEMKQQVNARTGYVSISKEWKSGDRIQFSLPMKLRIYEAKDDPNKVGFLYGPIVLAGELGRENFPETDIVNVHTKLHDHPSINVPPIKAKKEEIHTWMRLVDPHSLRFEIDEMVGNKKLTLIPFFALHHERYTLYWQMVDQEMIEET